MKNKMNQVLAAMRPGSGIRLYLEGGGSIDATYIRHDTGSVTIRLGGELTYPRTKFEGAAISVVNRGGDELNGLKGMIEAAKLTAER